MTDSASTTGSGEAAQGTLTDQLPRLGGQTLDVLELLLAEDRPMYVTEIQARLGQASGGASRYLVSLGRWGWVSSRWEPSKFSDRGRRRYYELTLEGRRDGPLALQRAGRDPVGSVLWGMLVRCQTAADAIVANGHVNRQEVASALGSVAAVLITAGTDLVPIDSRLAERFAALGKACSATAARWSPGCRPDESDRDQAWRALQHVVIVLRQLSQDSPPPTTSTSRFAAEGVQGHGSIEDARIAAAVEQRDRDLKGLRRAQGVARLKERAE